MVTTPLGYDGTVSREDDREQLHAGMEVFDTEGERVGTVADLGRGYFLVQDGLFTIRNMYLPMRAVAQVDETSVYLTMTKGEVEAMARADVPAEGDAWYGAAPETVRVNEIPLREQTLVMRTVATVTSEIHLRKGVTWNTERVATPVRRESVRVDDGEGGVPWREGR